LFASGDFTPPFLGVYGWGILLVRNPVFGKVFITFPSDPHANQRFFREKTKKLCRRLQYTNKDGMGHDFTQLFGMSGGTLEPKSYFPPVFLPVTGHITPTLEEIFFEVISG